jgi:beta-glucosidase-like glycosyl hydrolase
MSQYALAFTTGFQRGRPNDRSATNPAYTIHKQRKLLQTTASTKFGSAAPAQFHQGAATLKHFDANSLEGSPNSKFSRHTMDVQVDNFTLSDAYFPAFKTGIREAGAAGVMCSYNAVQGIPTCLSPLLKKAREQWGFKVRAPTLLSYISAFTYRPIVFLFFFIYLIPLFSVIRRARSLSFVFCGATCVHCALCVRKGYVTSDTDAVSDAYRKHNYSSSAQAASCAAVTSGGCDINSGSTYKKSLLEGVKQKLCTMADVDEAVRNTLAVRFALGLFDPTTAQPLTKLGVEAIDTVESQALNQRAARSSLVLLLNKGGTLPLATNSDSGLKLAVIGAGEHADSPKAMLGTHFKDYACAGNTLNCVASPLHALTEVSFKCALLCYSSQ